MEQFRFGVITDIQYADRAANIGRYYRNSIIKAKHCIDAINAIQPDFCMHLGDLIDWPGQPEKGRQALDTIMPVMQSFHGPMYYLIGNHDRDSVPVDELAALWDMPQGQTWYSFDHKGVHFIALDSNFDEHGRPYQPGDGQWDNCYVSEQQLDWLKSDLAQCLTDVVFVMVHALLDDLDDPHVIKNASVVRSILENSGKQIVVLQGHMHCGRESKKNGICYHTMRSIVNGRARRCFWIVEVDKDRIFVHRYDSRRNHGQPTQKTLMKLQEASCCR